MPFREEDLWNGYPEETNAPYGMAKKALFMATRTASTAATSWTVPVNLYGPGDNFDPETSHVIPALIRKCVEARETGRGPHVGEPGRRPESSSTWRTLPRGSSPPPRDDRTQPINFGVGSEIKIRDLVELIAKLTGFRGEIALG